MWGSLHRMESWPLGCNLEVLLLWLGLGALFSCAFIRVYRYHNILVKCDGSMWPVPLQVWIATYDSVCMSQLNRKFQELARCMRRTCGLREHLRIEYY